MSNYTHGHVIPLVGGSVIGATQLLGKPAEWIASWDSVFSGNDKYCLKYYPTVPYFNLEETEPKNYVDIITCLPPCAGLSNANTTKGPDANNPRGCSAPSNIHMINGSEFAMKKIKPKVIMVENAPTLYSKAGEEFAERINTLAQENGYAMTLIKTSALKNGLPQERTRSFFFLWKGNKVPVFNEVSKPFVPFHKFLGDRHFSKSPLVSNRPAPSTDPLWQFIKEKYRGSSDQDILSQIASQRMVSTWNVIYNSGWLDEACVAVRDERMNRWLNYTREKKANGLNIMDGSMKLAWHRTQALMWRTLPMLKHPYEDRWLMTSEALALMGFPDDFADKTEISTKNSNVICQNVPVNAAQCWLEEAVAALDGERDWIEPELKDDGTLKILRQSNVVSKKTMEPIWSI